MATNVICSRCGKPYLAYSSRSTINYKLRQGKPLICPYCMRIKRQAGALRTAQIIREKRALKNQPLQAPCGSMIVPGHKRCPQEFYCEHYRTCLDITSRADWSGWRIGKEVYG